MNTLLDIILLAGAVAWLSTALVMKDGPFSILSWVRTQAKYKLRTTVLQCTFCTGFWVGLILCSLYTLHDPYIWALIQFFGVLGIASAFRGASAEFG